MQFGQQEIIATCVTISALSSTIGFWLWLEHKFRFWKKWGEKCE